VTHGHAIGRHQTDYSYQLTPARNGHVHDIAECTHPVLGMYYSAVVLSCTLQRNEVCLMFLGSLVAGPCARAFGTTYRYISPPAQSLLPDEYQLT
jgi:hypothetical protein